MLGGNGGRQQVQDVTLEVELGQGDGGDAVLATDGVDEGVLVDQGKLQKGSGQGLAGPLLLGDGLLEAVGADQPFGDEELTQAQGAPALARRLTGQTTIRRGALAPP